MNLFVLIIIICVVVVIGFAILYKMEICNSSLAPVLILFVLGFCCLVFTVCLGDRPYEICGESKLVREIENVEDFYISYDDADDAEVVLNKGNEEYVIDVKSEFVSVEVQTDRVGCSVEVYTVPVKLELFGIYIKTDEKMVKIYLPESESEDDVVSVVSGFCTNCGTGIESHYKFCPDCGFKVED